MNLAMTENVLRNENRSYSGRGGVSEENRHMGFQPAFLDADTGKVYASRYANGLPAPFHLLDGLPDELILMRHSTGRVAAVKHSVTSGFVRGGRFFTREQAVHHVTAIEASVE
jgi:hypothetical protein